MNEEKGSTTKERKRISEKQIKIGVVILVVAVIVIILLWGMVPEEIYEVNEILDDPAAFEGKVINLKGVIRGWDGNSLNFTLSDSTDPNSTLKAVHHGALPEGFGNNITVVTKGTFSEDPLQLDTTSIQIGCPSRY